MLDSATAPVAAPEPAEQQLEELVEVLDEIEQDEDEIEEDIDGLKVRGKKDAVEKAKAERLMHADYTKKTQGVAEEKRVLEAERTQVQKTAQLYQAHLGTVAELVSLDKQIAQFQQVNWDALSDTDPVQAQKLDRQYRTLQEQRQQRVAFLGSLQQRHALEEQQTTAKQIEQAADYLRREIPQWSEKRDTALRDYAVKIGIPAGAIRDITIRAPAIAKALHKAELYDQLLARKTEKPKVEPQAEPVTRIAATRTTASRDPARMSDTEFAQWRKRQIAQRK